jgi:hypothetical protein
MNASPIIAMLPSMPVCPPGEHFAASNVDLRLVLGFVAPADAVAKLLPIGWEPDVAACGPAQGINLRLTFIDTLLSLDADGRAVAPPRIVHLSLPARKYGSQAGATLLGLACSTGGDGGPYGNSLQASATVERRAERNDAEVNCVQESWQFRTRQGHAIALQIEYSPAAPTLLTAEDRVHAAAAPDCCRIYRTVQAQDAVRRPGADRVQRLVFSATGPLLSQMFGCAEQLISVVAVPWYSRQVFVPSS